MRISVLTLLLAACGATTPTTNTPRGGPRGLRASEHRDLAAEQDRQARDHSMWPDSGPTAGNPGMRDQPVAMPWVRSWDTAAEHERLAAIHRSKAAELEAQYEAACGQRPTSETAVSPLVRYGVSGESTAAGATVYLSPKAGTADELLAALACHRAFMMLAPADMDDCPLDLPGLHVEARGDPNGITLTLTVHDPKLVPELQRRAAHQLEAHAGAGRAAPPPER